MNNKNLTIGAAIVAALVVLTLVGWFAFKPAPTMLQGEVDAKEIKVASKLAGRVNSIPVKEGQKVTRGEVLLTISSPEVEAKLEQARAARSAAVAQKNKADKGTRVEKIVAAKNMWMKAQAASELAAKTYERVLNLYNEGVIPLQQKDEAETQKEAAEMTARAARAQYDMAVKGARSEDKAAADAMVEQANGAVSEVESYLKETKLEAPIDGEISNIIPGEGELISTGFPVITIVDLNDIWVTFNIREDMLAKMRMGDEFNVSIPALGKQEVTVKITYINPLGDYATWRATRSTGDFDMKTFEVRAVPVKKLDGMRPGMSALINWDKYKPLNR